MELRKPTESEVLAFNVIEFGRMAESSLGATDRSWFLHYMRIYSTLLHSFVRNLANQPGTTLGQKVAVLASLQIPIPRNDSCRKTLETLIDQHFKGVREADLVRWAVEIPLHVIDVNMHLDDPKELDRLWCECKVETNP